LNQGFEFDIMNKMDKDKLEKIVNVFENTPEVKLAYLFGSQARGDVGPMSDYDFAVYLDDYDNDKIKSFKLRVALLAEVSRILETDNVDLVVINEAKGSEFKFNIIKDGKLIYEIEPYKVLVEPQIMNEYYDYKIEMRKYGLTKT
jgi:uncharacterized protein